MPSSGSSANTYGQLPATGQAKVSIPGYNQTVYTPGAGHSDAHVKKVLQDAERLFPSGQSANQQGK